MALLQEDNAFTHVIAIDFGTGASGYGIAPRVLEHDGKPRIEVFNPCDDSDDQKTVTAILFSDEHEFLDFGASAMKHYAEIIDDEGTALLFQNYKMHLLKMDQFARAIDGRTMPLMEVVSCSLKYIAERALEKLKDQVGKISLQKIRWVLTVPALWNEEHKSFMRRAAYEARIIDSPSSPNLLLCLEPEGASIQCLEDSDSSLRSQIKNGSVIMVLDCGGGTVDITVHKLMCEPDEKFLCKELLPSSGGCEWGSKYVDIYFEDFLEEFFGEELYEVYTKTATARLDILKDFEMAKRKFKGTKDDKKTIKLSYLGEEMNSTKLSKLIKDHNAGQPTEFHVAKKGSANLELSGSLLMSFFLPLIENIKSKVANLIEAIEAKKEKLNLIFMVGGFSESPFLKEEIKNRFQTENVKILVPRRPQISVIRGACMYGLNPRSITSRIAKKTYGINTLTTFDPERHPEDKKVVIEGEDFCEDVFDAFVRKGDSISAEEVHVKTYCPVRSKQVLMRIIFYCTEERDAEFIDEPGVTQLGELAIDIGKPFQAVDDKTVKVTLHFGSTHITAKATNKNETEVKNCEFKFECSS